MARQVSDSTIERMRELMLDGKQRTCHQASAELGLSDTSANHAMRYLHKRDRVFIARYERCPKDCNWVRVFQIGCQTDAKKPVNTGTRRQRAYLRREREYLHESRASGSKVFRHPWDVWLFGECQASQATNWVGRVIRQSMSAPDDELEAIV